MGFDVERATQLLDGACGVEFHMQLGHERAKAANALAGHADALLGTAVLCAVAGRTAEATELLSRAYTWLAEAIAVGEKPDRHYFPFGTEAMNHAKASLAHWLLNGSDAPEHQDRAVTFLDQYLTSKPDTSLKALSLYLPLYLDSRRYQRVVDLLGGQRRWKAPDVNKSRWSEPDASYLVAASRLHGDPSPEAVRRGVGSFLSRSLTTWMLDGQYADAARWIKITLWNDATPAVEPIALIHSCFAGP